MCLAVNSCCYPVLYRVVTIYEYVRCASDYTGSTWCRVLRKMPCPILLVFLYFGWFVDIK